MSYQYDVVVRPSSGLRLHLNENTAGCSPRVLKAIRSISRQDAAFYPDYDAAIGACAARFGIDEERFILTNGLDEGILATSVAALRERAAATPEAIVVMPAFDMYASTADGVGARIVEVGLDEAYADFSGETLLGNPEAAALPNLIVGRTFAKAYGIAGLRAGAIVGHPDTLGLLRRIVPPFSVNACAAAAIVAGLSDAEYYDWYREQVRASKALLYDALARLGIRYWPSAANFVLVHLGADARRVVDGLAARSVYVRDKSRDPACPGCVRITTGVVEHTEICIRALEEVMCAAGS